VFRLFTRVFATARKQLEALAEQTGGSYFRASRAEDLDGVYESVAAELHSFYSLAYTAKDPRNDGRWRKITIKVNRQGESENQARLLRQVIKSSL
jgi:hypothetical protein